MKLWPLAILSVLVFLPLVHADESMGSIHVYGSGTSIGPTGTKYLCPTMIYPMGSARFDANVTVKDNSGKSGQYAIEFDVSDINHGYFLQALVIEKNTSHLFMVLLTKNGAPISNQTTVLHGNNGDNFTLPQRKFLAHTKELSDFINLNVLPGTISTQWYGFVNHKFIIAAGDNAKVPADFTGTSETLLFVGLPHTVANFTQLNARIDLTQEESASRLPVSSYQSFGNPGPCNSFVSQYQSNACEVLTGSEGFGVQERMTD